MRLFPVGTLIPILAAALILGHPGAACACSCTGLTDAEAFDAADAVFTAELVDTVEPFAPFQSPQPPTVLEFAVDGVHKGNVAELQGVLTPSDTCAAEPLQRGTDYLVFASLDDGKLRTSLCSGSRPLDEGPLSLDMVTAAPVAGEADLAEKDYRPLIALAAALAAAAAGVVWWRRRNRG